MRIPQIIPYDRSAAVDYAHRWAFGRNPDYYDFEGIGGDCTNFASQCLYAGVGVMNFTPTFGWYYIDVNDRSPSWTGVEYFRNFLVRGAVSPGPFAQETDLEGLLPGDFLQFNFKGDRFGHTPIVVSIGSPATPENTLVAAHSYDADFRPLSTYMYQELRCLHILGAYPPDTGPGEVSPPSRPPYRLEGPGPFSGT